MTITKVRKCELELNDLEVRLLLDAISKKNIHLIQIGRNDDLILNNSVLRNQKTQEQIEQIEKERDEVYLGVVLLKRIANKIQANTYHEDETKIAV